MIHVVAVITAKPGMRETIACGAKTREMIASRVIHILQPA